MDLRVSSAGAHGIGHERDSTVLDEVCHQCFDTPSKVIHGIETVIKQRVAEAKTSFEQIQWQAHRTTQAMQRVVIQTQALVRERARVQLDSARHRASEDDAGVRLGALRALKLAVARVAEGINEVREFALGNRSRAWLARSLSRRAGTAGPRTTTLSCAAPSWRSSRVGR
jgi:exodeoxyribonuclease VII large subunit